MEAEIVFHGSDATRQHIRINGKPYTTESGWIPGANWDLAGFGEALKALFKPDCGNTFELAGKEELRGRQVTVYRYHSPLDGCFGAGVLGYIQINGPHDGRILADDTDGSVLQIEKRDAAADPTGPGHEILSWDYVKIGDASYLLPVMSDYVFVLPNLPMWHVAVQYRNHRHFEASTDVTFK